MFRLCGYSKIGQSVVSLLVQTIVLVYFSKDTSSTGSSTCRFIVIITYISTVLVVVMTLFEIVFQVVSVNDGNSTTSINDGNGLRSSLIDSSSSARDRISMTTIVRIDDEVMNPVNSRITTNTTNTTSDDTSKHDVIMNTTNIPITTTR